MVSDEIIATLNEPGVALQIGSRGPNLQPEVVRGFGFFMDDSGQNCTVIAGLEQAKSTLENLSDNKQIAVSLSHLGTGKTFQMKGEYSGHRELTEKEMGILMANFTSFADFIEKYYGPEAKEVVSKLNIFPVTAIHFSVKDIFNQSPGPGAGNKLN